MAEFTGERLIPGQVDDDLLNEHLARYAFAARLACGKRVLDAGCGAGYGSAELAKVAAAVTGTDVSADAIGFARENYRLPNLRFVEGSVTALPYADANFDVVVAFEVIEHIENWAGFIREVRRVLAPDGQFIVSTPNKAYYAETRERIGPNPFHVHEFDYDEFRGELSAVFPHVSLFLENHVEGVVFRPVDGGKTSDARVDEGEAAPAESHFFVAVCGCAPQPGSPTFVYIPSAGNVLRERERHIELLESELRMKGEWLDKAKAEHAELVELFRAQTEELKRSNRWAAELNDRVEAAGKRIFELQDELAREQAAAQAAVEKLEQENRAATEWALENGRQLAAKVEELGKCVEALHAAEATIEERTKWAMALQGDVERLERDLNLLRASRWVKVGRRLGLGPQLPGM